MELYIYVNREYKRVELFQDEKISVTSTIQNYSDIGKLFTDYSQSFTVPASTHNNAIFSHWYDNAVDNGYDARTRYYAYIEIDTIPFKEGNIQLEKANKKNGYIESYTLTFYGNLTQLKDKFGDDKLNSLDYTELNHTLDSTEIFNRIINNSYEVCYPLIGNNRKFEYLTATTSDITTNTGAIKWDDLFPAIPVKKIFEYIQDKYEITFKGGFLNTLAFTKLYMYLKNMELPRAYNNGTFYVQNRFATTLTFPEYNSTTNILTSDWNSGYFLSNSNKRIIIDFRVIPNSGYSLTNYRVDLYQDDIIIKTFDNLVGETVNRLLDIRQIDDSNSHKYKFKISSIGDFDFQARFTYNRISGAGQSSTNSYNFATSGSPTGQIIYSIQNIVNYVPDIKISDFFMGIVKMFNLIVTPLGEDTFRFEPLELFYQKGQIKDITPYIYSDELDIEKPKLFKTINFQYEQSENILNNKFREMFNRDYGDLVYNSNSLSESSNYDIKLPFENVMWEKTTGEQFITATLWNKDLQTYLPKPMLMYRNDLTTVSTAIKYTKPSGYNTSAYYVRFNNEVPIGGTDLGYVKTLNWGAEVSSWYLDIAPDGLYKNYYEQYIANLYNQKTRIIKAKAKLEPLNLSKIKLSDRLIIRDNRYIINSYTTDLTNGETSFELINDYRGLDYNSIGYQFANIDMIILDNTAQDIQIDLYLGMFQAFTIPVAGASFISRSKNGKFTDDTDLPITVTQNTTGLERTDTIGITYLDYEENDKTIYIQIVQEA